MGNGLPLSTGGRAATGGSEGFFWLKKWLKRRLVALLVKLNLHLKQ